MLVYPRQPDRQTRGADEALAAALNVNKDDVDKLAEDEKKAKAKKKERKPKK